MPDPILIQSLDEALGVQDADEFALAVGSTGLKRLKFSTLRLALATTIAGVIQSFVTAAQAAATTAGTHAANAAAAAANAASNAAAGAASAIASAISTAQGFATAAANSATAAAASAAIADRAAGGSNGQIQFNSAGALAGSSSLIWTGSRLGMGETGGAPAAELHIRKSTGDINLTLQNDGSGTSYINLSGPLVAYGGLRANNGTSEEWRLGGLGSAGTFGVSLAGVERLRINSQSVTIGTSSAPGVALRVGGVIAATGAIRVGSYTVATLPSASAAGAGASAYVTDSSVTTFNATVAGGGSNSIRVTSDGANWKVG